MLAAENHWLLHHWLLNYWVINYCLLDDWLINYWLLADWSIAYWLIMDIDTTMISMMSPGLTRFNGKFLVSKLLNHFAMVINDNGQIKLSLSYKHSHHS